MHECKESLSVDSWGEVREEDENEIESVQIMVERGEMQGRNQGRVQEKRYGNGS